MSMDRFTFGHPCGVVTGPNEALVVLVRRRPDANEHP